MITLEKIEQLVDMLTGKDLPEGMIMPHQPRLSRGQAFSVVWFLQEHLHVVPDRFEMCDVCEEMFDSSHDGHIVDGTDCPNSWQEEVGVSQEMLEQNDVTKFCSMECEWKFWKELLTHG